MSLQIPVQKDIGEYQEKIVGKMSLRTLACVSGGFASAVAMAAAVHFALGVEVADATLPVMAASLPFWLAGFWRPFGMKLEEFVPLLTDHYRRGQSMRYEPYTARFNLTATGPRPGRPKRRARRAWKRKGAELDEPTKHERQAG